MAYTTINKSTDFFNTKLYTGNNSTNAQTGVGFQPDLVWFKRRDSGAQHSLFDVVRGVTKGLASDLTSAESTITDALTSFDSDGFTLGADSGNYINLNSATYASWNWKAGTTSGLSGGTITPSAYSINTTSKFGIYKYTGNATGSQTIAHGLGATPSCVIFKQTSGTEQWRVHFMKAPNPYTSMLLLNDKDAEVSQSNGLSAVSSTTITFGNDGAYNGSGGEYICYVFCDVAGYSKFGSYVGNGNVDGTFVYTGFKPAFVMARCASSGGSYTSWSMFDTTRQTFNTNAGKTLYANLNNAEGVRGNGSDSSTTIPGIDMLSNGFKCRVLNDEVNNTQTYVYMAFGNTIVGTNNIPATAR